MTITHSIEHEQLGARSAPPHRPIELILIDDHAILRAGLRLLLDAERDFQVIADAGTIAEGVALAKRLQPDVVIIDLSFPEGTAINAIGRLRRECSGVRIIVLTVHDNQASSCATARAGADGFVAKVAAFEVLLSTIRSSIAWQETNAQSLPSAPLRGTLTLSQPDSPILQLTLRERQVLVGVAQGHTSREIAAKLDRSVNTVVKHRSNMMRKLSLHDASAVTRFAIANGLLSP